MPQESWVTATAFHDENTLLLPLLSEPVAEPSHPGKRKHHSLLDQQTGQPGASCTLHFCLADACRRATTGPTSLGRAVAFQDVEHKVCHHPSSNTLRPAPPHQQSHTCLTALLKAAAVFHLPVTFNTDKGVEAIKKHFYCPSQCKKRWKAIYL